MIVVQIVNIFRWIFQIVNMWFNYCEWLLKHLGLVH